MSCFRIKVDLTHYYYDARELSWIYIDSTKMWQIDHVKKHIHKLFAIQEPFHLLLNDTAYLPPNEDVRILQENECIVAVPGTGLKDEADSKKHKEHSNIQNNLTCTDNGNSYHREESNFNKEIDKSLNDSANICHKEKEIDKNEISRINVSIDEVDDTPRSQIISSHKVPSTSTGATSKDTTIYHSILDDTEVDTASESKATDSNMTEDCSVADCDVLLHKRKRIRRKKSKKNETLPMSDISFEESNSKKPKVINSLIISSGKHIRFGDLENEENNLECQSGNELSKKESYQNKSLSKGLSTLLALRQSSTPLTFTRRIVKDVKVENTSSDADTKNTSIDASQETMNGTIKTDTQLDSDDISKVYKNKTSSLRLPNVSINKELCEPEEKTDCGDTDPEKLSIMKTPAKVGDIIAFKMLKIAADYTPQVSNFILAETLSYSAHSKVYNFKVIEGKDEIQLPMGKFTLPEDETESVTIDTVTLNQAQLIEPRLVRECISELSRKS